MKGKIFLKTKIQLRIFAVLIFMFCIPIDAQVFEDILGHSGDYFNYRQFKSLFGRATTDVNQTIPMKLEYGGTLKGIAGKEEIESEAREGAWKVVLTGWRETGSDGEIDIIYCPSAVLNYGSRMEYVFYSSEVPSLFFDKIVGELSEIQEDMIDEFDDMKVNWGRDGNKILVSAVYPYTGGVSSGDIEDRIVFLMNTCRELIRKSSEIIADYKDDYLDQLQDKTYSYITKDEFEGLVSEMDIARFVDEESKGKEGSYAFTTAETRNFEFINNGENIEFRYWDKVAYGLKEDSKKEIFKKIDEWVKDNPLDNAKMVVEWYPKYEENILVKAVYTMNGSIEGEEIYDNFYEFKGDWSISLYDEIESIMEDFQDNVKEKQISYLEKGLFLILIDNSLFNLEEAVEDVPEGYWAFHRDETYQYEIYNYGNNLWMTSWCTVPENLSQEAIDEIIKKTQQFANENSFSNKFQYIVRHYPGASPNYIQIVASLEFPEPVLGSEIAEGYNSFVDDLAQDAYSHIEDLVDDYL